MISEVIIEDGFGITKIILDRHAKLYRLTYYKVEQRDLMIG
jgi:hypothetical protein